MSTTLPRARRGVAFLATTAVLLTACGGTDEPDGIASGAPSSATEAPSEAAEEAPTADASTDEATPEPTPSPAEVGEHGEPHGELAAAFGEARNLGPGRPVGVAPDDHHLFVAAPHPDEELTACEGLGFDVLWTVDPVDGTRRRAFAGHEDDDGWFGVPRPAPDGSGRAMILTICDAHFAFVSLVMMSDDGVLTDVQTLPHPGRPDEQIDTYLSAYWAWWEPDGDLVARVTDDRDLDDQHVYLRTWDEASGAWGPLRDDPRPDQFPAWDEPSRDASGRHEATTSWDPQVVTFTDTVDGRRASILGARSPQFGDGFVAYALESGADEHGWPLTDVVVRPFG